MMRSRIIWLLTLVTVSISAAANSNDSTSRSLPYTESNPLIYEDAYNQWPYSFINDDGEPDGFNIDVVKMVLKKLKIPYIIRLTHPNQTLATIKNGESNLTQAIYSNHNAEYGVFGQTVVSLMTHSIASPISKPTSIKKFDDIKGNYIIVNTNSICHHDMIEAGIDKYAVPHEDMPEAVMQISTADSGQVLWNTMSLKYLINKYHLSNIQITPILMDNDEYRFLSNDTVLLYRIDSVMHSIKAGEFLQPIRNKWFYPEAHDSGIPYYVWYIAMALVIIATVLLLTNINHRLKLKLLVQNIKKQNNRLALYMRSGKISMWTYDIEAREFRTYSLENEESKAFDHNGFSDYFNADDFLVITKAIEEISNGTCNSKTSIVRCYDPSNKDTVHYFNQNISILKTKEGKPAVLLGTMKNITASHTSAITTKDMLKRYDYVFNTSMADMIYFDENGILTDINDKACDTFGIKDKQQLISDKVSANDFIEMCQLDMQSDLWTTVMIKPDNLQQTNKLYRHISRSGIIVYELKMQTIYDDNRCPICTIITGIDITETTNAIKEEKKRTSIIDNTTTRISEYVSSINNAMNVSNIRIVNYYPDSWMMTIKQNLNKKRLELSQLKCLELTDPADHPKVVAAFRKMDKRRAGIFTTKIKTVFKEKSGRDIYLQLNFVPITDSDGTISHYFGLCRDVSELTETEAQLKEEMQKAQETELLKSAFMSNMSHDIRTPLNSIVGFSQLFDTEHSQEDEQVFIDEIKKNTNILLKLINDILFLSRLDANMIEFRKDPTDVVTIFKAQCDTGWSSELDANVTTVIDIPDNDMLLKIDGSHIGRITEILAKNAAIYCKHGEIRAKCEYIIDKLFITFSDTGIGMDEKTMAHLFDRYEETDDIEQCSTRLSLFICKELTEHMGGEINISSILGKGSVVRLIIPCERVSVEDALNNVALLK